MEKGLVFSDTQSEDFDISDSRYGETESNLSFTESRFSHGDTDARGFEELLEQLVESDNSKKGAPSASASFMRNLPRIILDEEQLKKDKDGLGCAICKELFAIGSETTQLQSWLQRMLDSEAGENRSPNSKLQTLELARTWRS